MTHHTKQKYSTRVAELNLRDQDILEIDIQSDVLFDRGDMEDLIEGAKNIGNGRRLKNLILLGKGTVADVDSRVLSASKEGSQYKIADAFVIEGAAQKLLMNIYINLQKPFVPTRFFTTKAQAIEWLTSQN